MELIKFRSEKIFVYLVFAVLFLLGLYIYSDYGATVDDEFYVRNGELYYEYIKILISNKSLYKINEIESLKESIIGNEGIVYHPVLFELLLATFVDILNLENSKDIYEFSHLLNFSIFFISLIFFYKLIYKKFNSIFYGLFSIIILSLTPRIFAESFYNSRDIFFLSLFIFNIYAAYNFLSNKSLSKLIYFSLTSALLINAKVLGIIPPILFISFYLLNSLSNKKSTNNALKSIFLVLIFTLFFIYIFWPYLWANPINNFIHAFTDIIKVQNSLTLLNFYLGESISSINTAWHYRIVWFFVTTPLFVLFLFIVGFCISLIEIISNLMKIDNSNEDLWDDNEQLFNYYLFFVLIVVVFITIKFNVSQFGAWRHLYFLYPVVIFFSLIGFQSLFKLFKNNKLKIILFLVIGINLSYIIFWNFKYHPHQQVYFNYLIKDYAKKNFELDYWGLSNIHSLKYILKNNINYPVSVGTISFSSLKESILLLDENNKKKIILSYDLDNADFLINNYMKRIRNNFIIDEKKYVKYFEIIVDGVPINTVYKKIN